MEDDDDSIETKEEPLEHVGYFAHRTVFGSGDLELIFASRWMERNNERGGHFLTNLLNHNGHDESQDTTQRDARVSATVVQWLGTNCGFSFLVSCLKEAGYKVVEKETERS
ncbi:MAG: hypothetical protein WAX80_00915 [Minisyncoccia bacterium]